MSDFHTWYFRFVYKLLPIYTSKMVIEHSFQRISLISSYIIANKTLILKLERSGYSNINNRDSVNQQYLRKRLRICYYYWVWFFFNETVVEKTHQNTPQTIYRNQIIIYIYFFKFGGVGACLSRMLSHSEVHLSLDSYALGITLY